jgi:hypothetical protein
MLEEMVGKSARLGDCAAMERLRKKCKMVKAAISILGDDIRQQLIFKTHDAVF